MTVQVCCCGELMWDLQTDDKLETGRTFQRVMGGAATNVALSLARRGVRTAVSGIVSDDALGHGYAVGLAAAGVDTSSLKHRKGRMGLVFMEQKRFLSYRPHYERWPKRMSPPQSWRKKVPRGAWVHVAALSADTPELGAQAELVRLAKERGANIFVDINARPRAWKTRVVPRQARVILAAADIVKASQDDLRVLQLRDDAAEIYELLSLAGTLVITRGKHTAHAYGAWGTVSRRPPKVQERREIGAGDEFCAALLTSALTDPAIASKRWWRHAMALAHERAAAHLSHRDVLPKRRR